MNFNQSEVNKVSADGTLLYTGVKKVKISVKKCLLMRRWISFSAVAYVSFAY